MLLGAGRAHVDDVIDPGAGLQLAVRVGDRVEPGTLLCTMYAASDDSARCRRRSGSAGRCTSPTVRAEAPALFHQL